MELYLSPSKVQCYETCPRSYYFKYEAKIPSEATSANLPFGTAVHNSIEQFLINGDDPVDVFVSEWTKACQEETLQFSSTWSDKDLLATGSRLLSLFPEKWEEWKFELVYGVDNKPLTECMFTAKLAYQDIKVTFRGKIDVCVFTPKGEIGVLDWKTPAQASTTIFAERADQHTAYQMLMESDETLEIEIDKVGYADLVKAKIPKTSGRGPYIPDIHWVDRRSDEMVKEYQLKILKIAQDITRGYFPRQPGMAYNTPCNLCDYQKVCMESS